MQTFHITLDDMLDAGADDWADEEPTGEVLLLTVQAQVNASVSLRGLTAALAQRQAAPTPVIRPLHEVIPNLDRDGNLVSHSFMSQVIADLERRVRS